MLEKNLTDFLCSLKCLNWKFNFIILSEIWGSPDTAKLNIIEGYSHVYDARQRRIGGGVSIYIDLRIPYRIRSDLKLDHTIFESIFIEVDKYIFNCKHNVILAAIYKPPNVNIDIFNKHLEKMLVAIQNERKYAFLIGDYNINTMDELKCKSTLTNDFVNVMSLYSYKKLICIPTRVINNSSTILDNIYSNLPDIYNNGTSGVLGCIRTTDHMPIFSIRNVCKEIIKGEAFKLKRNFGN